MAFETPALVVGAGLNGLGVARSLARAGVPVWMLAAGAGHPALHTRAAKILGVRSLHGDALIDDLVRLGETRFARRRPVLLLTQEAGVSAVSRGRGRLEALYRFTLPTIETVAALQHKQAFQRIAEAFGASIPALVHVHDFADLAALSALRYPVVVKPAARHVGYSRHFQKAYKVECVAQARELVVRILDVMTDVVIQEWIAGPDSCIHFCLQAIDRDGRTLASFTGRKIRSWPPAVGGTASCVPAPRAHAQLTALTTRFFHRAGVVGLAGMEYKRDTGTGAFLMIEPTIGRTDYQEEVATLNGVNLPFAAYCAELGLEFPRLRRPVRPTAWCVRSQNLQSALAQHQHPWAGYGANVRVVDALWRMSDPLPGVLASLQRLRAKLRTHVARRLPGRDPVGSRS